MKNPVFPRCLAGICAVMIFSAVVYAQNPVVPFRSPRVTFTTQTGQPLSGGCIFTYQGGTNTPQYTYTDSTGSVNNPNPVPLDTTGSAVIWLGTNSYKFIAYSAGGVNCASGSLQWTVDNVPGDAFLNGTISGATITTPTITGGTDSGTAISSAVITNSTIDSTTIGGTTPAAGNFTTLSAALDALSFSSTPVFPAASYGYFTMTLTGNVTSSSITGGTNGQLITFNLCQNGTGQVVGGQTTGFTFAWPASYLNPPVVNPILNACTIATAYYYGGYWYTVSTSPQLLLGNFDTITYSTTPVFPAASYSNFAIVLAGNVISSTLTGGTVGQLVTIDVCQNGTGGSTFVWPANLLNAPPVSSGASTCTGLTAVYNGTNWTTVASSSATTTTPLTGNLDIIPFTATPIYSVSNFSSFEMTLSGNVTSSSISTGTPGQLISIVLKQGSSTTTAPVSAPTSTTLTTGGLLPATTTYYAECSYLFGTLESLPSTESSRITGTGTTNSITWTCPSYAGVTTYKFYLGTGTGGENYYFTSASNTYIQTGLPSTGTPGLPYTGSTYTVVWPTNLINGPTMSTGIGATTSLIAVYDGTNWITLGSTSYTSAIPHSIVAIWNGSSGTLVDDSEGGSGYQSGATSWGTTIYGTYYVVCSTVGWTAGSTLGRKIVWTTVGTSYSSTQFTYGVDSPTLSAGRGQTVPVTCMAVQ